MVHCYFLYIATQAFVFNDFNFAYAISRARTLFAKDAPRPGAAGNFIKTVARVHFKTRKHALCRRYGNYGCNLGIAWFRRSA